tara:strand:+ start:44 stop:982 length:939 start_codon:yes stop_codon:yes gene_type:complete
MATKTVKVTLTEKNDAGPLFDLFYSINGGGSFTSSADSTNLYLPYVGASTVANVDENSNTYELKSKGVCINSAFDNLPTPTPTPTPTACRLGLTQVEAGYGSRSGACYFSDVRTVYVSGPFNTTETDIYLDANGCTFAPAFSYSDGIGVLDWNGSTATSAATCSGVSTPSPTGTPTPTPTVSPSPTPSSTPGPTPTPSFTSFGYHSITKSGTNQFKCVWSSSSQAYQAFAMIQYLTGQSSPTQSTPYAITSQSVKVWDSLGTERVDIDSAVSSTAVWFYDGFQVVVEWNDVSPTGTYANGSTYSDTWGYQKA